MFRPWGRTTAYVGVVTAGNYALSPGVCVRGSCVYRAVSTSIASATRSSGWRKGKG